MALFQHYLAKSPDHNYSYSLNRIYWVLLLISFIVFLYRNQIRSKRWHLKRKIFYVHYCVSEKERHTERDRKREKEREKAKLVFGLVFFKTFKNSQAQFYFLHRKYRNLIFIQVLIYWHKDSNVCRTDSPHHCFHMINKISGVPKFKNVDLWNCAYFY